eukprot:3934767-Rhodomonas_salina.6
MSGTELAYAAIGSRYPMIGTKLAYAATGTRYLMIGTELVDAATVRSCCSRSKAGISARYSAKSNPKPRIPGANSTEKAPSTGTARAAIWLRACYAMSGTDIGYAATHGTTPLLCDVQY